MRLTVEGILPALLSPRNFFIPAKECYVVNLVHYYLHDLSSNIRYNFYYSGLVKVFRFFFVMKYIHEFFSFQL